MKIIVQDTMPMAMVSIATSLHNPAAGRTVVRPKDMAACFDELSKVPEDGQPYDLLVTDNATDGETKMRFVDAAKKAGIELPEKVILISYTSDFPPLDAPDAVKVGNILLGESIKKGSESKSGRDRLLAAIEQLARA